MEIMKKLNILEIQGSIGFGGSERHTLQLCRGLSGKGHKVILVTKIRDSQVLKELRNLDIKVYDLNLSYKNILGYFYTIKKICEIIKIEDIEIIHTHLRLGDFAGGIAGKITGVPVIANLHGGISAYELNNEFNLFDKIVKYIHAFLLRRGTEKIIAISNFVKNYNIQDIGLNPNKVVVIHNATDYKRFDVSLDIGEKKKELEITENNMVVAQVGGIGTVCKGTDLFIKLAQKILKERNNITFLLVGGSDYNIQRAKESISEIYLKENKIVFTGIRTDIPEILQVIDILVNTSKQEGFGRVVTEAMSAKKPVIAFNTSGPAEIINHGKTGYLAKDMNEINDYIDIVLQDNEKRFKMGEEGRERVKRHFSVTEFVNRTEKILKSCL
jgi:glycosyltransferase involved in cell wall biosynthesis